MRAALAGGAMRSAEAVMRCFTRVVVVELFLVPAYLAVQFVHQFIHSGIQVVPDGLGVQARLA